MSGQFLSRAAIFWQTQDWIRGALAALASRTALSPNTRGSVVKAH